ncbi:nucleotidyltransferase family protein [Nocardioides sp. WS12]|uniref:nucleotidyltransferase family protein n=1 Tax=Nocardioides sp. WS12 TaxID=2486272 RepID=UPI0015FD398F|nr:nucleotidyltransferase family protein [Nocardioides sp. WS12]
MAHGLLLAAGAGRRMGLPKALVTAPDGVPWLLTSVRALAEGGCDAVTVVLGASAEEAAALLADSPVEVIVAADWENGMGASLAAGLRHLGALDQRPDAALVHLVDLPDVGPAVIRRVLGAGEQLPSAASTEVLRRAAYRAVPGHPVLLGRAHWAGILDSATGDQGARSYLASHDVALVECGNLATGDDVDHA